jgi:hypothetical protein
MKPFRPIILALLFFASGLFAQNPQPAPAAKSDSSAGAAPKVHAPMKTLDDDLILDDNDKPLLPAEKKQPPARTVAPSPVSSPTNAASRPAADTTLKNTPPVKTAASAETTPLKPENKTKDTVKKVRDEELILDGGEEDLLGKEKRVPAKNQGIPSAVTAAPDSAGTSPQEAVVSQKNATVSDSGTKNTLPVTPTVATIEQMHSINFARNLKEYRSPKLAMLMSLVLPGSGQIYAKANLWAAAFSVVEVALISTGLSMSAKSKRIKKDAHSYADKHYNSTDFQAYSTELKKYLRNNSSTFKNPDSIYNEIFFMGDDTTFLNDARKKNDAYYDNINGVSSPYIRGWDDVTPAFLADSGGYIINPSDTARFGVCAGDKSYFMFVRRISNGQQDSSQRLFGMSTHQEQYDRTLKNALHWADYSRTTFITLLVNHIASAVMAGILAKKHNDELLGNESFWHHIDIEQNYVNTGSGTSPGYALQVRF